MLASVITFLIYVCILALVIYLIIWVLRDVVGLPIPEKVIQILCVFKKAPRCIDGAFH